MENKGPICFKSGSEKEMLDMMCPSLEKLPYPLSKLPMVEGGEVECYEIPEDKKAGVLQELYPFSPVPSMDDSMLDIHEDKLFKVSEFMVIRERGHNYLVSPYYPSKGGTVLDWVPSGDGGWDGVSCNALRKDEALEYPTEKLDPGYGSGSAYVIPEKERLDLACGFLGLEPGTLSGGEVFFDMMAGRNFTSSEFRIACVEGRNALIGPWPCGGSEWAGRFIMAPEGISREETLAVDVRGAQETIFPLDGMMKKGCCGEYFEYIVPEARRQDLLSAIYPFRPVPPPDATMMDTEAGLDFTMRECRLVRLNGCNYLASPYYSGAKTFLECCVPFNP